jgi:hypothetical protein
LVRTTDAGTLVNVPSAQSGWQSFSWKVPMPHALLTPHDDHVIAMTVVLRAHQMYMSVGRIGVFVPPRHDATTLPGNCAVVVVGATVVVVVGGIVVIVVDTCAVVVVCVLGGRPGR